MSADVFLSKYKKGDFVVLGDYLIIFDSLLNTGYENNVILFHAIFGLRNNFFFSNTVASPGIGKIEHYGEIEIRPANNREKKTMLDEMHMHKQRWNPEAMSIENEI